MLVPLQGTLPGWPVATEPTAMQVLGLLVGVPAVIFVIITLLVKSKSLISAGRGESDSSMEQPLWLGAAPADRAAVESAAVESGAPGDAVATVEVGGASARW